MNMKKLVCAASLGIVVFLASIALRPWDIPQWSKIRAGIIAGDTQWRKVRAEMIAEDVRRQINANGGQPYSVLTGNPLLR
jgi:hypothetical protein